MKDLVDTTEMYLRTIFELEEEGITPLRARIAERLEQSGPTVSQTIARMERDGLVVVASDRSLQMTVKGRALAISVMRKHRLAERLLVDILGLDINKVHEEACRWEHVMSEEVERRVISVIGNCERSPFGNPIPGLEQLGVHLQEPAGPGVRATDTRNISTIQQVRIVQINEILQVDPHYFKMLYDAEMTVGTTVELQHREDGGISLIKGDKVIHLDEEMAHAVRVEAL
ncbi:FeoA domain-containing protein [Corynebacterium sp. ES2794-CONJ1]|uniref:metal-dependent transcriptional regulator n=1 Tax=unclassified Corynebacterium TaxID=2624378 RepID=UPI00216707FC|nr:MULTISPECIES: metal-dependent transcriptional regulator [unclassified Corynebacterium]MCS4489187.1 FeoA domain-containing protein [Corynebacterium sp. ES2775-CONJ]MCS4491000.1 FeoA domain-containing protein [Corynebacterium sp. ES2715-CONJ3]MCS4531119.1 FeoA domain-containing protein [Corynebacterium sp. ES2730-CONJ]MCU9518486.1 FeoA domain-containing protein [Corynebacterium sp. ES2794-CONJ1]